MMETRTENQMQNQTGRRMENQTVGRYCMPESCLANRTEMKFDELVPLFLFLCRDAVTTQRMHSGCTVAYCRIRQDGAHTIERSRPYSVRARRGFPIRRRWTAFGTQSLSGMIASQFIEWPGIQMV